MSLIDSFLISNSSDIPLMPEKINVNYPAAQTVIMECGFTEKKLQGKSITEITQLFENNLKDEEATKLFKNSILNQEIAILANKGFSGFIAEREAIASASTHIKTPSYDFCFNSGMSDEKFKLYHTFSENLKGKASLKTLFQVAKDILNQNPTDKLRNLVLKKLEEAIQIEAHALAKKNLFSLFISYISGRFDTLEEASKIVYRAPFEMLKKSLFTKRDYILL